MLEKRLRKTYQKYCVDVVAKGLAGFMSPNQLTLLAGILGILVIPALYWGYAILAAFLLLLSGYCDTLDGTVARLTNRSDAFGSSFDIVMDRVVEASVIMALFLVHPTNALECLSMLIAILICISSFLVVGIFTENSSEKSFFYSEGVMERAEAFIFFIAMMLLPHWFVPLAWLFVVLVLFTALLHLWRFKKYLELNTGETQC